MAQAPSGNTTSSAGERTQIESLTPRGRATITVKNGIATIKGNDPIAALQKLAKEAGITIRLTVEEAQRLEAVGRMKISTDYAPNDKTSAIEAAHAISIKVAEIMEKRGHKMDWGWVWPAIKKLAIWLFYLALPVAAFFLVIMALDAINGTHRISNLIAI